MTLCCPCYCCCAMFAGLDTLIFISALTLLPSVNHYVLEVDCSPDLFGGYAIPRDALHHLTNCDVAKVNDSADGAYLAVGSFRVDPHHEPYEPYGSELLVPGQSISFLGNLSSGTLREWKYDAGIFRASKSSVSAATMIAEESLDRKVGSALCGVICALSLVGSAYFLFFFDSRDNSLRLSELRARGVPPLKARVLGLAAVTWLASAFMVFLTSNLGFAGLSLGVAAVLGCLFLDGLEGWLFKLKDALLSLKSCFTTSRSGEPLLLTHEARSPALLGTSAPEAAAAIQPDQVEGNTSLIRAMLIGIVAGLGAGVLLSLGLSTFVPH